MRIISTLAVALATPAAATAQSVPIQFAAADAPLDEAITVTATRTATPVIDVPATVSVITTEEIEANLYDDIKDLVRFEPGVSVRSQPSRFGAALGTTGRDGNSGFNIRGLEGNRVLIQTDGIRLPDGFAFGAQSVGRGDLGELDLVKSVEILRGPASALYGSDGLAGAVSLTTKDPADLLDDGASVGGRLRVSYADTDDNWAKGAALAGRIGPVSALVAYTRRDASETGNRGRVFSNDSSRTAPNPQDIDNDALLAKLVWDAAPGHRLRATYELNEREIDTPQVLTGLARPPLAPTSVIGLRARDTSQRERASLDWRYDGEGLVRNAELIGYWQQSHTRQFTAEDRNTVADRVRDNRFDNEIHGATGQAVLGFATGPVGHRITGGFEYSRTTQTGLRDGVVPPAGETFPTKAFPDTRFTLAGVFAQDELSFADGKLILYPALRVDYYKLRPEPDSRFPGVAVRQDDTHMSPKLGAIGWLTDSFGAFANYASGFKAPTPSQVNNGFANITQNYVSLAAPDLKPETSNTFEGGLRLRRLALGGTKINASLTGFTGRYKRFIEQRQVSGSFTPADPAVFQFVNLGRVRISGVEARADADLGAGFALNFAAAYARGTVTNDGVRVPLSSIDPVKLVGGVSWRDAANRVGGQAIATHATRKNQSRVAEVCSPDCFTPPDFTILDLTAFVRPVEFVTLRIGIFNVTNEKFTWWSDIRGLSAASTVLASYTQPGRNVSASATVQF